MESFLAHLRMLVGVPFDYLVPDSRLLPDESIRFFYIDRSWTDRLVDGAIAVGKIGTREQAHHQAQAPTVQQQLDLSERMVRDLQRGGAFVDLKSALASDPAQIITGFLLRSAAVSGWPQMDVRAYGGPSLPPDFQPGSDATLKAQLLTLRLERLSPGVLIALFQGVPTMVMCEEPHHGVQFGVNESQGIFSVFRRQADGNAYPNQTPIDAIDVPVRKANRRVLAVSDLRRALINPTPPTPVIPPQTGSASFAIELLNPPWRQRFENEGGWVELTGTGAFVANVPVAAAVTRGDVRNEVQGLISK